MTTYVYPLAEPIQLSKCLRIQLDNPRTEEEVSLVEKYLLRAYESGEDYSFPIYSDEDVVTVENTLFRLRDAFSDADSYLKARFESYEREEALRFVASIWIVARYDDEGEGQRLQELHTRMRKEGQFTFSLLDDDHPIMKGERTLADYSYLLSLLINSEGDNYFGRGLIIASPEPTTVQDQSMWFQLLLLGMICSPKRAEKFVNDSLRWVFFPYVWSDLESKSRLVEKAFEDGLADKFLYVGSLLRIVAEEARNEKIRLVILTSILELLVTHSPDYSRFNVEESISKQFRLKVSLLVYLNDRNRNINEIANRLKVIYEQRSNVAHGNFEATTKYIKNLSKNEGEEEYFDDLISDLYTYVRAIVEEYMKDKQFVEFLKTH